MAELPEIAEQLLRSTKADRCFAGAKKQSLEILDQLLRLLFPQFAEQPMHERGGVILALTDVKSKLEEVIQFFTDGKKRDARAEIASNFLRELPGIAHRLRLDAEAIHLGDPASQSVDEVIIAYPGFYAIAVYRVAHKLYSMGLPTLPRILTEHAHQLTGIDIHPGATVGEGFCIDHGTGIVIGETAVIGGNVKIYQGVTLGALSVEKGMARKKRHPTLENNVVVYSNATILGGETVIGQNSIIGGNVWLTESVPANSIVYQTNDIRVRSQANDWSI